MEYHFAFARTALKYGLQILNKSNNNNKILIPNYICEDIIQPIKINNLEYVYYELDDNFQPVWDTIEKNITNDVKFILMVHYFGKNQNIEKFIEICGKHNLYLIEDNAHGYGGTYKNKMLGEFGNMSISSPRKLYNIYSGGILKFNSNINLKVDTSSLQEFVPNKRNFIKKKLDKFPLIKKNLKILIKKRAEYENIDFFRNVNLNDYLMDKDSYNYLKTINFNEIKKYKNKEFLKWMNFAIDNNIKPVFSSLDNNLIPWCFPAYVKDNNEAIKWFDWGWKNNVDVFSWPTLPLDVKDKNKKAFDRWKKLICFPLNSF